MAVGMKAIELLCCCELKLHKIKNQRFMNKKEAILLVECLAAYLKLKGEYRLVKVI